MAIKVIPDVVSPVVVAAADILTNKYKPDWNEWVCYGLTAFGYIGAFMGLGRGEMADFIKNLGISSLPLTAQHLYTKFAMGGSVGAPSRLAFHPAMRSPIRQTTVPEYETIKVS